MIVFCPYAWRNKIINLFVHLVIFFNDVVYFAMLFNLGFHFMLLTAKNDVTNLINVFVYSY